MYKPLEFVPQQTRVWRIQPEPEPIPAPDQPGPWTTIAHKLGRVIAVLASQVTGYVSGTADGNPDAVYAVEEVAELFDLLFGMRNT